VTKADLVNAISQKTGLTKKASATALDAMGEAVMEALASGDKVQLLGFGSFNIVEKAARTGRRPRTGEALEIPARKADWRFLRWKTAPDGFTAETP